jgi:transcriptional regulator with XRE-family HTH domain
MTPNPHMEAHMDPVPFLSPDAVLQDLGDRLRQLRKNRQLRQLDMESLGLSYKYYQRLESGQVNPTLVTLHKLANAFEVSVYDLLRPETQHDTQTA